MYLIINMTTFVCVPNDKGPKTKYNIYLIESTLR